MTQRELETFGQILSVVESTTSSRLTLEIINRKDIWDIISTVGILLAGFGGLKIMLDYINLKEIGLNFGFQILKRQYPISMLGKTYYIWKYENENAIWLIDKKRNIRRHIANQETNAKMGWRDKYELVSKEEIEKYKMGDEINIKSLDN